MTAPRSRPVLTVLLVSGALGLFLGMVRYPQWQDALEPAQVLAGLVQYPHDNPVYLYSTGAWTLLHQIPAVLLRWGWSEQTLAILLSGLLGMLSLQALAMFIMALSDDVWLAIAGSFLIYWSDAAYDVSLMNTWTTYGVVGLSYMLLAIALIGAGHDGAGAALLGLGFAVHPAWALWITGALASALVAHLKDARIWTRRIWPFFLAGLVASAVSATLHYWPGGFPIGLHIGPPDAYLTTFNALWDAHRRPLEFTSTDMAPVYVGAALAALWAWRFRDTIPSRVALLLRVLVAAALLGTVLSLAYRFPPSDVPELLLALMPSRLFGLSGMTCTALIIGLAGRYRTDPEMQLFVALFAIALCVVPLQSELGPSWDARRATLTAAPVLVYLAYRSRKGLSLIEPPARTIELLRRAAFVATAVIFGITAWDSAVNFTQTRNRIFARDHALAVASGRPGLLLTAGGMHLVQLQTRRAVLLDGGALDAVNYVPAAAPEIARILQGVYGIDFFHPTGVLAQEPSGALDAESGRALWETRTHEDWRRVGQEFGITDVLTPAGWSLKLPVIDRSSSFVLYGIR